MNINIDNQEYNSEFQKMTLKNVLKIAQIEKSAFLLRIGRYYIYILNLGVFMRHIGLKSDIQLTLNYI